MITDGFIPGNNVIHCALTSIFCNDNKEPPLVPPIGGKRAFGDKRFNCAIKGYALGFAIKVYHSGTLGGCFVVIARNSMLRGLKQTQPSMTLCSTL